MNTDALDGQITFGAGGDLGEVSTKTDSGDGKESIIERSRRLRPDDWAESDHGGWQYIGKNTEVRKALGIATTRGAAASSYDRDAARRSREGYAKRMGGGE
jgi:hypothetical protein